MRKIPEEVKAEGEEGKDGDGTVISNKDTKPTQEVSNSKKEAEKQVILNKYEEAEDKKRKGDKMMSGDMLGGGRGRGSDHTQVCI